MAPVSAFVRESVSFFLLALGLSLAGSGGFLAGMARGRRRLRLLLLAASGLGLTALGAWAMASGGGATLRRALGALSMAAAGALLAWAVRGLRRPPAAGAPTRPAEPTGLVAPLTKARCSSYRFVIYRTLAEASEEPVLVVEEPVHEEQATVQRRAARAPDRTGGRFTCRAELAAGCGRAGRGAQDPVLSEIERRGLAWLLVAGARFRAEEAWVPVPGDEGLDASSASARQRAPAVAVRAAMAVAAAAAGGLWTWAG